MLNNLFKVIKNILALTLSLLFMLDIFSGYQWYCNELVYIGNLYLNLFSICTLLYILNSAIAVGILRISTKYSYTLIGIILTILIIFKILILVINIGFSISLLISYIGNFLGILLGIVYFKYINSNKRALLFLMSIWFILNVVYPF